MTLGPEYAPPRAAREAPPSLADRRRAARAFAGWLVGASLVGGAARALQAGQVLSHFSMEAWAAFPLALSALRVDSAHVAASAAGVALVMATRDGSQANGGARPALRPWHLYAAVPLATPVAAALLLATGLGTTAVVYHVPPAASWQRILETTTLSDPLVGVALACAFALALGALATFLGPRLATLRWGLAPKVVAVLLATGLVTGVIRGVAEAVLTPPGAGLPTDAFTPP